LMLVAVVWTPLGGSNEVMVPYGFRTKPCLILAYPRKNQ